MSLVIIPDRFALRRGTAADLAAVNETLLRGEWCLEIDTGRFKIGDGSSAWNDLDYAGAGYMDLSGLADGDTLVWDATAGLWVPGAGGGGGGAWSSIIKPSNENRVSTTTFADDSHFTWALTAGETYVLRGVFFVVLGLVAAGFKYQFNYTGSISAVQSYRNNYATNGGSSGTDNDFTLAGSFLPSGSASGNTVTRLRFAFDILITPSSDGTLSLQWAQVSSSAAGTAVMAGSWAELAQP